MKMPWNRWVGNSQKKGSQDSARPQMTMPQLIAASVGALTLALALSACQSIAKSYQYSLVRVIDASTNAPALNVFVGGTEMAANIGDGTITSYGTLPTSSAMAIVVKDATATSTSTSSTLLSTTTSIVTGAHYSLLVADSSTSTSSYTLSVLEDQHTAAASGQSAFRFINEATNTGAVDIYVVPSTTTLAKTAALETDLTVGTVTKYVSFASQTVTIVIVPTGTTVTGTTALTDEYTSSSLTLTGGEVRTVLIVDSKLTSAPTFTAVIADDMN
jgi:hypothetical protein